MYNGKTLIIDDSLAYNEELKHQKIQLISTSRKE